MTLSKQRLQHWTERADFLKTTPAVPVPLHILLKEADEIAEFIRRRWAATEELPGLQNAGEALPQNIGLEIEELKEAVQTMHSEYLSALNQEFKPHDVLSESTAVLDEMIAATEWHAMNSEDPALRERAYLLSRDHALCFSSVDAMINGLYDYASHIQSLRDDMQKIAGFDLRLIERAFELAILLIDMDTKPHPEMDKLLKLLSLRDRLAALLHGRMVFVRGAARFVFRFHQNVLREALSARLMRQEAAEARAEKIRRTYARREQRDYPLSYLPPNSGYMPEYR